MRSAVNLFLQPGAKPTIEALSNACGTAHRSGLVGAGGDGRSTFTNIRPWTYAPRPGHASEDPHRCRATPHQAPFAAAAMLIDMAREAPRRCGTVSA